LGPLNHPPKSSPAELPGKLAFFFLLENLPIQDMFFLEIMISQFAFFGSSTGHITIEESTTIDPTTIPMPLHSIQKKGPGIHPLKAPTTNPISNVN